MATFTVSDAFSNRESTRVWQHNDELPEQWQTQLDNLQDLADVVRSSVDNPPTKEDLLAAIDRWQAILEDGEIDADERQAIVEQWQTIPTELGLTPEEIHNIGLTAQAIVEDSQAPQTPESLLGTDNSDLLWGQGGDDTLTGSSETGNLGEVDLLIGGAGADTFVLGDESGTFYDDGLALTAGTTEFAFIADFDASADRILLAGTADDYLLGELPESLSDRLPNLGGTALYRTVDGGQNELISVIYGAELTNLESGFTFV